MLQDERGSLSLIGNQRGSLDLFGGSRRSDSGSGGSGGPSGPDGSSNGPEFDLNTAEGRHEALRQKLGPVYENAPPQKQALMHDAIRAPDGFRSRTMSFGHGTVQLTAGTGLMSKTLGTGLGGPALGIGAGFTMPAVTRGVSRLRGALGPRMPDRARSGWQTGVRKTDDALLGAESRLGAVRDRISSLNPFSSSDSGDADVDVEAGQYRPDMRDGVREGMDDAAPDEMSDFAPETYKAIEQLRAQRYDTGFESATMSYLRDATALSATNVVAGEVFSAAPRAIRNVGVPDGVRGLASDVPTGRVSNLVNSDGARFGMRSGALGTTKATVSRAGGAVRRTIDSASGRYESAKRAVGRIDQGIVNIEGPIVEEARTTYRSFRGDTSRPEDHTRNVEDVGERNHLDARRNNENPVLRDEFKDYFDGEINDLPPEEVDRLYSLYLAAKNGELGW